MILPIDSLSTCSARFRSIRLSQFYFGCIGVRRLFPSSDNFVLGLAKAKVLAKGSAATESCCMCCAHREAVPRLEKKTSCKCHNAYRTLRAPDRSTNGNALGAVLKSIESAEMPQVRSQNTASTANTSYWKHELSEGRTKENNKETSETIRSHKKP